MGGMETDVDGAGLVERPDLTKIGRRDDEIGSVELLVAGRDLEPFMDLERAQPVFAGRGVDTHDEDVGAQSGIGGEKLLLRLRSEPAGPE